MREELKELCVLHVCVSNGACLHGLASIGYLRVVNRSILGNQWTTDFFFFQRCQLSVRLAARRCQPHEPCIAASRNVSQKLPVVELLCILGRDSCSPPAAAGSLVNVCERHFWVERSVLILWRYFPGGGVRRASIDRARAAPSASDCSQCVVCSHALCPAILTL